VRQQAIAFSLEQPVDDTDQQSVSVDLMTIDDVRWWNRMKLRDAIVCIRVHILPSRQTQVTCC
jgi:hypothetical protein